MIKLLEGFMDKDYKENMSSVFGFGKYAFSITKVFYMHNRYPAFIGVMTK